MGEGGRHIEKREDGNGEEAGDEGIESAVGQVALHRINLKRSSSLQPFLYPTNLHPLPRPAIFLNPTLPPSLTLLSHL